LGIMTGSLLTWSYSQPVYCQGKGFTGSLFEADDLNMLIFPGGVAERYQFTVPDTNQQRQSPAVNFQQLSSGSMSGLVLGYLLGKASRIMMLTLGGITAIMLVCAA
jgi:hypothetical protein